MSVHLVGGGGIAAKYIGLRIVEREGLVVENLVCVDMCGDMRADICGDMCGDM